MDIKGQTTIKNLGNIKWTAKPFENKVFIENKGQFDPAIPGQVKEKILFGAQLGEVWAFFTSKGVIYRYDEYPALKNKTIDPDKDTPVNPVTHVLFANWSASNPDGSLIAKEEQTNYYSYPKGKAVSIIANAYKKIIYKNLYPGIDVEFTFPKDKDGIEYSIILRPGADLSAVKINYSGADALSSNALGDIIIKSGLGNITDHRPSGFYKDENIPVVCSSFLKGSKEQFMIEEDYDKSKTIVIDPWVTDPNFSSYDRAYDICYDYQGNVYAYGGIMSPNGFQLVKFNSFGQIQWTYSASAFTQNLYYYGDFAVDRKTGTSYITSGFWESAAQVLKVNTYGALLATYNGNSDLNEMWRAVYNACYDNIVIGAGGTSDSNQACMLDTNLVTITPVDFLNTSAHQHDVATICVDPTGLQCYMSFCYSYADPSHFDNVFVQLPLPNLSPATYIMPDHFNFNESQVAHYIDDISTASGSMNGMAASPNWLYLYDGMSLKQFNKNTGILNDSTAVSDSSEYWGGIDVDACDDIYLGCRDSIKYYDKALALQGSIPTPGNVYCLTLGQNNMLYAGGDGFVTALSVPNPPNLISTVTTVPTSCNACDGKAIVTINCGISPFSYTWSNGSTNQQDTGMCEGLYTITVTDASCPPKKDSAMVTISSKAGYYAVVIDSNPDCALKPGSITVYPKGGVGPYTYNWSNGESGNRDTGLSAGTYTATITDNTGCKYPVSVTLINPNPPNILLKPNYDSICSGANITLNASGGKYYKWAPDSELSCDTCPSPTASPTVSVTYTVTGTDSNGCTGTAIAVIKVTPSTTPAITGPDKICQDSVVELQATPGFSSYLWQPGNYAGQTVYAEIDSNTTFSLTVISTICNDTLYAFYKVEMVNNATPIINPPSDSLCLGDSVLLTAKGGNTYHWSTGATTASIFGMEPNTYTVTVSNNGRCPGTATATIYNKNGSAAIKQATDSICKGDSVQLIAEGGNTYLWSNGLTSSSIYAKDTVQTTYTVTVSTNQRCPGTATANIYIKTPLVGLTLSHDNFCAGDTATLTASGGIAFLWSNGATASSITIKPDTTGPFSVAITNACGTKTLSDTVHVIPLPVPVINGPTSVCRDSNATLTGSGGTTYVWSNGETSSSIALNKLTKTTTYTLTAFNGPCAGQTTTTITILPPPNVSITKDSTICSGDSINLKATGGGTYKWNTTPALTSDSIWVSPASSFSYSVTVTNVCVASASNIITVDIPSLAVSPDTTIFIGDTALLLAYSQSANTKYVWMPNYFLSCNTCPAPLANPPQTTTYTVAAVDGKGCGIDKIVTVYVEPHCYDYEVPNVFTPNGDGINDQLVIKQLQVYENVNYSDFAFSITIYDRWGKVMYKSTLPAQYWNGKYMNTGAKESDGVYFYIITSSCQTNGQAFTYDKKGFVQLIR